MAEKNAISELRVVLVSTRNPLNIGAAARAMSNFGFHRLRLVNPYVPGVREARSAVGAASLLEQAGEFDSLADAVADCSLVVGTTAARERAPEIPLRVLQEAAPELRARALAAPVAIVFGSEKRGLSNKDLSYCHFALQIPTQDMQPSLNLGSSVAVVLYELARLPEERMKVRTKKLATAGEAERFFETLFEGLLASGYVKPGADEATRERIRRMVRRLDLPSKDVEIWLGILRKMLWKMRSEKK